MSALTIPVHLGKLAKRVHGGKGQEEKKGGQFVPCCVCAVWWCGVLNGGLCRITLVACCISDIIGSAALTDVTAAAVEKG